MGILGRQLPLIGLFVLHGVSSCKAETEGSYALRFLPNSVAPAVVPVLGVVGVLLVLAALLVLVLAVLLVLVLAVLLVLVLAVLLILVFRVVEIAVIHDYHLTQNSMPRLTPGYTSWKNFFKNSTHL